MPKPNISEAARSSDVQHAGVDGNMIEVNEPVFLDDISSVDANSNKDEGILDNCGIIPNNCLPCLASTIPSLEKRRSCSSPPSSKKKAPPKLSSRCEFEFLTQQSFISKERILFFSYIEWNRCFFRSMHLALQLCVNVNILILILLFASFYGFQFLQRHYKDQLQVLKYPSVQLTRKCLIVGHTLNQELSKYEA